MSSRYAADTSVSTRQSQAAIQDTLDRYGADMQMVGSEVGRAVIAFRIRGKQVRIDLPLPAIDDYRLTESTQRLRSPQSQRDAWDQACRSRWRVLLLLVKAKLEAVECGISTLESEFLSNLILPSGQTVGEWMGPQIENIYITGTMPSLLPERVAP